MNPCIGAAALILYSPLKSVLGQIGQIAIPVPPSLIVCLGILALAFGAGWWMRRRGEDKL